MEQMRALLSQEHGNHLIIGVSKVQFEAFIRKGHDGHLDVNSISTIANENMLIKVLNHKTDNQCIFINCSSLPLFVKVYACFGLNSLNLKKISLTFLEPQLDYSHIELFSPLCIYGIKGWDYNCPISLNEIDLSSFTPYYYIKLRPSLSKNMTKIFEIRKRIRQPIKSNRILAKKQKTLGANSLISISKEIKSFTQNHQCVTSSQLIQHIIELVKQTYKSHRNRKEVSLLNIHRRVYDAINIMCAIDIIKKENNQIIWLNNTETITQSEELSELCMLNQLKKRELKTKMIELNLYTQFYQSNLNKTNGVDIKDKVPLPFNYLNHHFNGTFRQTNHVFTAINSLNNRLIPYEEFLQRISPSLNEHQSQLLEDKYSSIFDQNRPASNDYLTENGDKSIPSLFEINFAFSLENTSQERFFEDSNSNNSIEGIFQYDY